MDPDFRYDTVSFIPFFHCYWFGIFSQDFFFQGWEFGTLTFVRPPHQSQQEGRREGKGGSQLQAYRSSTILPGGFSVPSASEVAEPNPPFSWEMVDWLLNFHKTCLLQHFLSPPHTASYINQVVLNVLVEIQLGMEFPMLPSYLSKREYQHLCTIYALLQYISVAKRRAENVRLHSKLTCVMVASGKQFSLSLSSPSTIWE